MPPLEYLQQFPFPFPFPSHQNIINFHHINKQTMAPPNTQKRVKGVQIFRPFVYGTTAIAYGPSNPKPSGVPEEHTHSWTVFVRGVGEDSDITYWCKKVQFKLHESIPQPLRSTSFPSLPPVLPLIPSPLSFSKTNGS